jgi:K(+)-stimulated pyrophosphate-energized sodium pump
MRVLMLGVSVAAYLVNQTRTRAATGSAARMNFEAPLTRLIWLTSAGAIVGAFIGSYALLAGLGGGLWWQLAAIISCGTLAAAVIPTLVECFTSTDSKHVQEVVSAARQGGASLNILSGLVAGNFSGYWLGLAFMLLMATAYGVSQLGLGALMIAPAAAPVFAFGLVAFGLLGTSPVTIAVDSYGPVTDNAQSVYELSQIEQEPGVSEEIRAEYGFVPDFEVGKDNLERNDAAGNTFKATAKPVLIGTAAVGATTMIFSIVVLLTEGLRPELLANLSILHPPFLLGLLAGAAVIYWFTGASIQAVTTGAYRAVEFIRANICLDDSAGKASAADSKRVVEICTKYAQAGMVNIFLALFFGTLGFAFVEPYFFIGYLVSIAIVGLYQAIFMANAGGAWDNGKKVVETELHEKGTDLHAATVVGDMVGDPFKDTSSVAMNPVIKFTTLFGLLTVQLAVSLRAEVGSWAAYALAAAFLAVSFYFVRRSFVGMRIETQAPPPAEPGQGGEPAKEVRGDERPEPRLPSLTLPARHGTSRQISWGYGFGFAISLSSAWNSGVSRIAVKRLSVRSFSCSVNPARSAWRSASSASFRARSRTFGSGPLARLACS